MGLRILAILMLLAAHVAPALAALSALARTPIEAEVSGCCTSQCCCTVECGCSIESSPEQSIPTPEPAAPTRTLEQWLRIAALPGRLIAVLEIGGDPAHRRTMRRPDGRTPVAFRGASAQAALCTWLT